MVEILYTIVENYDVKFGQQTRCITSPTLMVHYSDYLQEKFLKTQIAVPAFFIADNNSKSCAERLSAPVLTDSSAFSV